MKEKLKVWSKKWWFWVIVVILVIGIFGNANTDNNSKKTNKDNNGNNTKQQEVVTFLDGTNSEDFISILSSVTGITNITGVEMGDSITYAKSNDKYSISLDADKNSKKIDYVCVISLTDEDATNVFMAFNRMNYTGENDAEFTEWLTNNIGKNATKKIGSANYELSLSTTNHPILTMKSDGSDAYQQEQIDKATK